MPLFFFISYLLVPKLEICHKILFGQKSHKTAVVVRNTVVAVVAESEE